MDTITNGDSTKFLTEGTTSFIVPDRIFIKAYGSLTTTIIETNINLGM